MASGRTQRSLQLGNAGFGGLAPGFGGLAPGFGALGLGFRTLGLGFGALGLGFGALGLGFGALGLGFGVLGLGFGALGGRFDLGPMPDEPARRRVSEAQQFAVRGHVQAQALAADHPLAIR